MRDTTVATALSAVARATTTEAAVDAEAYLCVTCGTQFTESSKPPEHCAICEDERQYVGPDGQEWT
jgi:hypothetical protein